MFLNFPSKGFWQRFKLRSLSEATNYFEDGFGFLSGYEAVIEVCVTS